MRLQIAAAGMVLAILIAGPLNAQDYRKWDIGGGLGILGTSQRDFGGSQAAGRNTDPGITGNFEGGRYFTTHVKAEAGLMKTNARSYWDVPPITTTGAIAGYTSRRAHPTSVSAALTYQFFENVFAHPYVSAGVRLTSIYEESETYFYGSNVPFNTVTRSSRRYAEARPFVAAGYKSYFDERIYLRSEFLIAIDGKGASHGTVRVGVGFDF